MVMSAVGLYLCVVGEVRRNQNMSGGGSKKEPENIVMANMSEQMRLNTLLFIRYFTLPSKLEKNKNHR